MKIEEILKKDFIIANLFSRRKQDALRELAEFLETKGIIQNQDTLYQALMERESLGSTGIGENVAIPHAKSDEVKQILTVFGLSREGINFDSLDQKPVYYVCLLIAPTHSTGLHLKALARISKLLNSKILRQNILEVETTDDIYSILLDEDAKLD